MSYRTFAEVVAELGGLKRYHEDTETGRAETEESHPFFDEKAADADRIIDAKLKRAGYIVPLATPLTDGKLRTIAMGIYVGLLTKANSNRQAYIIEWETAALKDLDTLASGDSVVFGAETDDEESISGDIFASQQADPLFDFGDPFSTANDVFSQLGPGPRRWR